MADVGKKLHQLEKLEESSEALREYVLQEMELKPDKCDYDSIEQKIDVLDALLTDLAIMLDKPDKPDNAVTF
jgi:hypothetical protein